MLKTTLLTTILAAATLAAPSAASADIGIRGSADLSLSFAPLPHSSPSTPGVNVPGFVWVSGHWATYRGRVYWSPGYYMPARAGYVYQQPRWTTRKNGRSVFKKGRWIKSRRGHVYRPGRYIVRNGQRIWIKGKFVRKTRFKRRRLAKRNKRTPRRYYMHSRNRRAQVPMTKPNRMRDYRKLKKQNKRESRVDLALNL